MRFSGAAGIVEHELGRGILPHMGANRPGSVIHVENRGHRDQVHVDLVIGFQGPHIAPVKRLLPVLVDEVEGVNLVVVHHPGQNVVPEVVARSLVFRVFQQRRNEHIGVEQVNAHRGRNHSRVVGRAQVGLLGLLLEADNSARTIDLDYAKMLRLSRIDKDRSQRDVRARILMLTQHQVVIHLVDVIARQDKHVARLLRANGVDILVHRIGRAHIPVLADPFHWRQDLDELSQFTSHNVAPAFTNVPVQRQRFVLRQDIDFSQIGVDTVGQRNVNDAVNAAEGDGRLGTIACQRI